MPVPVPIPGPSNHPLPSLRHLLLDTTFCGSLHPLSSPQASVHQYRGIKFASVPARFRQSTLFDSYPPITDATQLGPICPQKRVPKAIEETVFGIPASEIPEQHLKQDEFECLNLNITCPAGLTPHSRLPVMLWIHGGGDRGSGAEWYYDGGALVHKSILYGKPVILVTFNFRIGLLGFAANAVIREDNKAMGEQGTGNYGLRDQRIANEWVHRYISEFGGDPTNITLFGSGTGAADIVCHLLSQANLTHPVFHRSIIQSAIFEPPLPDVASAGWALSRVTSALQLSNIDKLRRIDVEKLLGLGQTMRAVDDKVFFRDGWQSYLGPVGGSTHHHQHIDHSKPVGRAHHGGVASGFLHPTLQKSRNPSKSKSRSRSRSALRNVVRSSSSKPPASASAFTTTIPSIPEHTTHISQPIIIGDSAADSLLWSIPVSLWTSAGVVRRMKAVCQSLNKTSAVLRAYDISSYTPNGEITERVLELVNDARVAWPTHCIAQNASRERGDSGVWRFVFDQEGPSRGVPHYAADLMYLFDNVPLPATARVDMNDGEWSFGSGSGSGSGAGEDGMSDDGSDAEPDPEPCVSPGTADTPTATAEGTMEGVVDEEEGEGSGGRGRCRTRGDSFSSTLAAKCQSITVRQTKRTSPSTSIAGAASALSSSSSSSPSLYRRSEQDSTSTSSSTPDTDQEEWLITPVDEYAYRRVRDAMQERWISFAHGEVPWREDKVFVFGPEGEVGERSKAIFEGRRRRKLWKEAFEPLGPALVHKFGVELSRGPASGADR